MLFEQKLKKHLGDNRDNEILLHADCCFDENGRAIKSRGKYFRLTSQQYHKRFFSIWGVFDDPDLFNTCLDELTQSVRAIRDRSGFTSIVTCTATGKLLMDRIRADVERGSGRIETHYLGNFPFINHENQGLLDFRGKQVLILTDVISSGSLVKNLAEVITHVGGEPVGVQSVMVTNTQKQFVKDRSLRFRDDEGRNLKVSLDYLGAIDLEGSDGTLRKPPVDSAVRRINHESVLPDDYSHLPQLFKSAFEEHEMVRHLEQADALDFDFYRSDFSCFTTAVRISKFFGTQDEFAQKQASKDVLRSCTNRIRSRHKEFVEGVNEAGRSISSQIRKSRNHIAFVTTYEKGDCEFADAVIRYFREHGLTQMTGVSSERVSIPKSEGVDESHNYFLPPPKAARLRHKCVYLLLSSVNMSEKLRSIAAVLAASEVCHIEVICLVNRMGKLTNEFVSRLKKLLRGIKLGDGQTNDTTVFDFYAVYSLNEINSDNLVRVQRTVESLLANYCAKTKVRGFRRKMEHERKYFRSSRLTSDKFQSGSCEKLHSKFPIPQSDVPIESVEGKLYLITSQFIEEVNPESLEGILKLIRDRRTSKSVLYKLYAVLLSELNRIKADGYFDRLKRVIKSAVKRIRKYRLDREATLADHDIAECIDREVALLFGYGIFSYLDRKQGLNDQVIQDAFTGGVERRLWASRPRNMRIYLEDENVWWVVSVLLHFSHHDFSDFSSARVFKDDFAGTVGDTIRWLENDRTLGLNVRQHRRIKTHLGYLLTELGVYDSREHALSKIIRYLHSRILYVPARHNPMITLLRFAVNRLRESFQSILPAKESIEELVRSSARPRYLPTDRTDLQEALDDAISAASELEQAANSVAVLCELTSPAGVSKRYWSDRRNSELVSDAAKLGNICQAARTENLISAKELNKSLTILKRIEDDFYGEKSKLVKLLRSYVVSLDRTLEQAIGFAKRSLQKAYPEDHRVYARICDSLMEQLKTQSPDDHEERLVLCDSGLLRECLKNTVTNMRHGLSRFAQEDRSRIGTEVCMNIGEAVTHPTVFEDVRHWRLTLSCPGKVGADEAGGLPPANSTFARHAREVEDLGGSLTMTVEPNGGTEIELRLIRRDSLERDILRAL